MGDGEGGGLFLEPRLALVAYGVHDDPFLGFAEFVERDESGLPLGYHQLTKSEIACSATTSAGIS